MTTLLINLLKQWKATALLSLSAGVAAALCVQHMEIDSAKRGLAAEKARYALLEASNTRLLSAIDRQNAAVAALALESRNRRQRAAQQMARAKKSVARYADAKSIAAMDASGHGDTCARLHGIINAYAQTAVKERF